jgi:hypothetical protein
MPLVNFRGASGELRVGYQKVAELRNWSLDGTTETVEAQVENINAFWIERRPLELRLNIGKRPWTWKDVQLIDKGPPMRIRVSGKPNI